MGENISKPYIKKEINIKTHKELIQFNSKKKNRIINLK